MTVDLWAIGATLIAFALIVVMRMRGKQSHGNAETWLPLELRAAKLPYAERLFRTDGPVRISARVDRAYRDRAGRLTLVELKTRRRDAVYPSDVIELAAQRAALMAATGKTVSAHAYVLVQGTDVSRPRTHRVELLTEAQVLELAERRQALLSGEIPARPACTDGICKNCVFAGPCRGYR
jgi:hypothetical protein